MTDMYITPQSNLPGFMRLGKILLCLGLLVGGAWYLVRNDDDVTAMVMVLFILPIFVVSITFTPLHRMIRWNSRTDRTPRANLRSLPVSTAYESPLWDRQLDGF